MTDEGAGRKKETSNGSETETEAKSRLMMTTEDISDEMNE
jgi:hypothetical protein